MHGTRLRVAVSVRLADEPTTADSTQGRMGRPFKLLSRVMAWCTGLPVTRPGFNARDGSLSFHSHLSIRNIYLHVGAWALIQMGSSLGGLLFMEHLRGVTTPCKVYIFLHWARNGHA